MQFQNNKRKKSYNINILKYILKKIITPFSIYFLISSIVYANKNIQALELINEARAANNLPILQYSKKLENVAAYHAMYLAYHQICSHTENEGYPIFTGEYHWDRARNLGYSFEFLNENIECRLNKPHESWKTAITSLFSAIYHRFAFLSRNIREIGYDSQAEKMQKNFVFVMGSNVHNQNENNQKPTKDNICSSKQSTMILYPWPNQQDFYPTFFDIEYPDPTPFSVSGNPISVQFNPNVYQNIEIVSFSLTDVYGYPVETWALHFENDVNKRFTPFDFAWFPLQPLQWKSLYSVQLKYKANGEVQEKNGLLKQKSLLMTLSNEMVIEIFKKIFHAILDV